MRLCVVLNSVQYARYYSSLLSHSTRNKHACMPGKTILRRASSDYRSTSHQTRHSLEAMTLLLYYSRFCLLATPEKLADWMERVHGAGLLEVGLIDMGWSRLMSVLVSWYARFWLEGISDRVFRIYLKMDGDGDGDDGVGWCWDFFVL